MMRIVKIAGLLFVALVVLTLATRLLRGEKKSGFANCVVAASPQAFVGKHLKFTGEAERKTVQTPACVDKDRAIDGGDGPRQGRVRWVECLAGPDCDEAGMF